MGDVRPRIVRVAVLVVDTPDPGSIELAEYGPFHFGMSIQQQKQIALDRLLRFFVFFSVTDPSV